MLIVDALGPPGRWIRHKLLQSILYGTPVLLAIQVSLEHNVTYKSKFYFYISSLSL